MKKQINDVIITESSSKGYIGQSRGIIYLNNRTLRNNDREFLFSIQTYDRVISTAILSEEQTIELIKDLELLLVEKEDRSQSTEF